MNEVFPLTSYTATCSSTGKSGSSHIPPQFQLFASTSNG